MRLKLLLFALLLSGILSAQDTIRTLIITQARLDRADNSYVEITNVGDTPIQMSDFELGRVSPWDNPFPWTAEAPFGGAWIMLPEKVLQPGESYVIASVLDFTEKMYPRDPDHFNRRITKKELWTLADLQMNMPEANAIPGLDSVTPGYQVMETWGGRDCWYIEQHLSATDSVVVDQVGGVFDSETGQNYDQAYDVAGVTGATGNSILVRKFTVKSGNTDFANARGVDIDDSEWMPIPQLFGQWEPYRAVFWTLGNHGDYKLDENTLVSTTADIDWTNNKITVPWGTRNQDNIMNVFEKKPGLSWHYDLSPAHEDSAYMSARTGDKVTLYACGNTLETNVFDIEVAPPTSDANWVIPMFGAQGDGTYSTYINEGGEGNYGVTVDAPGMDTITNSIFGITYATPVDSLFKYLEKAPKASWEIVWVDGVPRTDVKTGDILRVKAENGDVKDYYIKVSYYRASHNSDLSAITWPDIPEYMKGLFGWQGDTIPNFTPTVYNYAINVPAEVDGIPAIIAKTEQLNAKVEVTRAVSLQGTSEQRTITFTVTAEDDTTQSVYTVLLSKEKSPLDVQPYKAEPFMSELVWQEDYNNGYVEIANPGNQVLDLSDYMFFFAYVNDPASAITSFSGDGDWGARYRKYVPGYKWVDEANWAANPGTLVPDINVSPLVFPGDVFVAGHVNIISGTWNDTYPGPMSQCDVILNSPYNPWDESYTEWASAVHEWWGGSFFLFKILNDSIKLGLKPANDPNDFQVIEAWGMGDGSEWNVGGYLPNSQCVTFIRKPQYHEGRPEFKESFGTNSDDTEWIIHDQAYWQAQNLGWPFWRSYISIDLGKHFMNEVTSYKSTVSSTVYKVSPGYGKGGTLEDIRGMKPDVTSTAFMNNIIKADPMQGLRVKGVDGELAADALLSNNDTLVVMSADSTNVTKYLLEVSEAGLSSDARLKSTKYNITVETEPKSATGVNEAGVGNIKGFEYGTSLITLLDNITVPAGARLDMINGEGAYVSLLTLNFDTSYVNVTVNDNIFFDVLAEDGVTRIVYQLMPDASDNDAFLTSDVYSIAQKELLIQFVPRGTSAQALLSNLVPSAGATMKLVDKLGHERMDGQISVDDKVVVTSKNGTVSTVYYISALATEYIFESNYLAYIVSNAYGVDQLEHMVSKLTSGTSIADFMSRITPALGATAVIVDANGVEKASGNIMSTDMVKVTSADGKTVVMYDFDTFVSSNFINAENIELYPNPTTGKINVRGVVAGNRIQVFNTVGALIRDISVQNSNEVISLDNQPSGLYMIVVTDNNNMLGRYKAIKK